MAQGVLVPEAPQDTHPPPVGALFASQPPQQGKRLQAIAEANKKDVGILQDDEVLKVFIYLYTGPGGPKVVLLHALLLKGQQQMRDDGPNFSIFPIPTSLIPTPPQFPRFPRSPPFPSISTSFSSFPIFPWVWYVPPGMGDSGARIGQRPGQSRCPWHAPCASTWRWAWAAVVERLPSWGPVSSRPVSTSS